MLHNEFGLESSDPLKNKNTLLQNDEQIEGFTSENEI